VPDGARLYPVGRLDQDSEGLLVLTNDGEWAERLLHPRHGVEREYALALSAPLDGEQVDRLRAGITLDEGHATLAGLRPMTLVEAARLAGLLRPAPPTGLVWYRATLTQGWKRQLRRMFGAVGAPIHRLVRVRIGPVRIDGLRTGAIRPLKAPEIRGLGAGGGRSRAATSSRSSDAATGAGAKSGEPASPRPASPRPASPQRRPRPPRPARPG
jgi:pseudouridine synthase